MFTVDYSPPDLKALRSQGFVADMHFHTAHSHDCRTPVKDVVMKARRLGIHVAITDHNKIGGVLEALKYKDAPIIPSIEICTREGKEVIPYFYDARQLEEFYNKRLAPFLKEKNALRSNRMRIRMADLLDMLEDEECVIHLPHPFAPQPRRSYNYLSSKRRADLLAKVDTIEAFNQTVTRRANLSALGWAVQLGKGIAGGSDGHLLRRMGCGVTVTHAASVEEHLVAIRKGEASVVGKELRPHERVIDAQVLVRNKISNGVAGGLKKGITFPARASRRILERLKRPE